MCIRDNRLSDSSPERKALNEIDRTYLSAADGFTLATTICLANRANNLISSIVKGDCNSRSFGRTSATDRPEVSGAGSRKQPQDYFNTERSPLG